MRLALVLCHLHLIRTVDLSHGLYRGQGVDQGTFFPIPIGRCIYVEFVASDIHLLIVIFFFSSRSRDSVDAENPGNNLYVTGLSSRVTERELEKHFETEGKV